MCIRDRTYTAPENKRWICDVKLGNISHFKPLYPTFLLKITHSQAGQVYERRSTHIIRKTNCAQFVLRIIVFGNTRTPIFNQRTAKPFEGYAFPKVPPYISYYKINLNLY